MEIEYFYAETLKIADAQLIQLLSANSKWKPVKKGEIMQHIGSCSSELLFLWKGLLRGFVIDAKGKEITDCIAYKQGTPIISCMDLGAPSPICIEAIEDSELIALPYSIVLPLLESSTETIRAYNRLLQDALKIHWEKKMILARCTASERYQWFLESHPGLIDRMNHKYVASFLGIAPESLSRVRRAMRLEEKE